MAKQTSIEQDGTIIEALSNAQSRVGKRPPVDCAYFRQDEDELH
jgi:hypothetical protein